MHPQHETIKILTVNGRGLKTKISIMRKMLQQKPDIMVWTEHHLPQGTQPPRWAYILLPRITDGDCQAYPKLGARHGVLMAVHKDLLAGTEPHIIPIPEETQGFLYQMELKKTRVSPPLAHPGAYLPTGPSAPLIRPVLYKHIEHQQQAHPHHVHILAGDMNAALYTSDRAQGRQGPLDKAYRQSIKTLGLLPMDPPQTGPTQQRQRPNLLHPR
jgi:hypothetical protein